MPANTGLRADQQRVVSIRRSWDARETPGVVRRVGAVWALVQVIDDLRLDGWECLRLADVARVRRGEAERFAEHVLRRTRRLSAPAAPLDTTSRLLSWLARRRMVALECEGDRDFLLGRILEVDDEAALVQSIDVGGCWRTWATRVTLTDVTRVAFGDHSARMYARHGSRWCAPRRPARDRA